MHGGTFGLHSSFSSAVSVQQRPNSITLTRGLVHLVDFLISSGRNWPSIAIQKKGTWNTYPGPGTRPAIKITEIRHFRIQTAELEEDLLWILIKLILPTDCSAHTYGFTNLVTHHRRLYHPSLGRLRSIWFAQPKAAQSFFSRTKQAFNTLRSYALSRHYSPLHEAAYLTETTPAYQKIVAPNNICC